MEIENLIKLIETVSASKITGLKYEENGMKLHLTKKMDYVISNTEADMNITASDNTDGTDMRKTAGKFVESPLVGIFYAAPSEDAAPFVSVGDAVKKGQTLAIIEAMKLMNEIESEYDGVITDILVENGKPVEYGQPLFKIC